MNAPVGRASKSRVTPVVNSSLIDAATSLTLERKPMTLDPERRSLYNVACAYLAAVFEYALFEPED